MAQAIHVLYLVYGEEHIKSGLSISNEILGRTFPGYRINNIVINNALNDGTREFRVNYLLISGDNAMAEFSGWDKGYSFCKSQFHTGEGDLFFFINDTFHRAVGQKYLNFFSRDLLPSQGIGNHVIGFLDDFPKPATILGITYTHWIRSNLFLFPSQVIEKLDSLQFPIPASEIFESSGEEFWSPNPQISDNFKAYISCWLFNKRVPGFEEYALNWKNCEPLTDLNRLFFQRKALCILSEHYLTARIKSLNVPILNLNKFPLSSDRHIAPYYDQNAQS